MDIQNCAPISATYTSQFNNFAAGASSKMSNVCKSTTNAFMSVRSKVINYIEENKREIFFAVALTIFAVKAPLYFLIGIVAYHCYNIGEKPESKEETVFQN